MAAARFPALGGRGLGLGLDLRWGDPAGFQAGPDGTDQIAPALRAFLHAHAPAAAHVFFSWQPRDRGRLRVDDYAPAWDDLMAALPAGLPRGLHHTALNLAALDGPPGDALLAYTNALCRRYGLGWINEDVGFWSLGGRPMPYPLPPILNSGGLAAVVRNVRACQQGLDVPLVLEFPGFSAGVSLVMGDIDAYDFFRRLAGETAAPVTLDIAHLLSWRWWRGFRDGALYGGLDRLPLDHAFEIHLSGCHIEGDRFIDAHDGHLLPQQLSLLEHLLPLCPNLRAVTFEDPRLTPTGALDATSAESWQRLRAAVDGWQRLPDALPAAPGLSATPVLFTDATAPLKEARPALESALAALLFDSGARAAWRRGTAPVGLGADEAQLLGTLSIAELDDAALATRMMVRRRTQRGTGSLVDAFPRCLAGWLALHPDDEDWAGLVDQFLASPQAADWRERPGGVAGATLEECFAAFARTQALADPVTCDEELLGTMLRTLAVCPDPTFLPPVSVQRAPAGWFAISAADPPVLHAALDQRYLRGAITPLIAALLRDGTGSEATGAAAPDQQAPTVADVRARLCEMGLLAG